MSRRRAVALLAVLGLGLSGCGSTQPESGQPPAPGQRSEQLPPPPSGQAWAQLMDFAFLRPRDWQREARQTGPGEQLLGFTGPQMTAGVTPQVGLGAGTDYPNSLSEAAELNKTAARTRYPGYEILEEGPVALQGAEAYRIVYTYRAFTERPATVRAIDILVQTPGRVQGNFFVAAAEPDFKRLRLESLAESLTVR